MIEPRWSYDDVQPYRDDHHATASATTAKMKPSTRKRPQTPWEQRTCRAGRCDRRDVVFCSSSLLEALVHQGVGGPTHIRGQRQGAKLKGDGGWRSSMQGDLPPPVVRAVLKPNVISVAWLKPGAKGSAERRQTLKDSPALPWTACSWIAVACPWHDREQKKASTTTPAGARLAAPP